MYQKTDLINFWKDNFGFREIELNAFKEVDRENFIPENLRNAAYQDMPLPLLRGKTISQPTTVMIMTHALELERGEKVFEIGAGSGYQSAIIAKIIGSKGKVITTEVVPELVQFARENLKKANIHNVFVYEEDGSNGLPSEAPFDRIIITSACKEFPKPLSLSQAFAAVGLSFLFIIDIKSNKKPRYAHQNQIRHYPGIMGKINVLFGS